MPRNAIISKLKALLRCGFHHLKDLVFQKWLQSLKLNQIQYATYRQSVIYVAVKVVG